MKYNVEKWDRKTIKAVRYEQYDTKEEAKTSIRGYKIDKELSTAYMETYTRRGSKYMYFLIEEF